jgi:hypothetical protein
MALQHQHALAVLQTQPGDPRIWISGFDTGPARWPRFHRPNLLRLSRLSMNLMWIRLGQRLVDTA